MFAVVVPNFLNGSIASSFDFVVSEEAIPGRNKEAIIRIANIDVPDYGGDSVERIVFIFFEGVIGLACNFLVKLHFIIRIETLRTKLFYNQVHHYKRIELITLMNKTEETLHENHVKMLHKKYKVLDKPNIKTLF